MLINYEAMDDYQKYIDIQFDEDDEQLAGYNCPLCGYPIVIEKGLELCYHCGWSKDEDICTRNQQSERKR